MNDERKTYIFLHGIRVYLKPTDSSQSPTKQTSSRNFLHASHSRPQIHAFIWAGGLYRFDDEFRKAHWFYYSIPFYEEFNFYRRAKSSMANIRATFEQLHPSPGRGSEKVSYVKYRSYATGRGGNLSSSKHFDPPSLW